jgi:uncharacterized protein (DUF488 family)
MRDPPNQALRVATIGVYEFDGSTFLKRLQDAEVALLLDVRQRRGVRGPSYAWANARRLQASLAEAGIAYRHLRELAPSTELRQLQYEEDARHGVGKRSRRALAPAYVDEYIREVLDEVDLESTLAALPDVPKAALLCVERDPEACHRSLIAERLADRFGVKVEHLRPASER